MKKVLCLLGALWFAASGAYACAGGFHPECTGAAGYSSCFDRAQSDWHRCVFSTCYQAAGCTTDPTTGGESCDNAEKIACENDCLATKYCSEQDCKDFFCSVGCSPADPWWPYC